MATLILLIIITYLSLARIRQPEELSPITFEHIDKVVHVIMYFGLACGMLLDKWLYDMWKKRRGQTQPGSTRSYIRFGLYAYAIASIWGGLMEILQMTCTNGVRSGDWWDWVADMVGAAIALLLARKIV